MMRIHCGFHSFLVWFGLHPNHTFEYKDKVQCCYLETGVMQFCAILAGLLLAGGGGREASWMDRGAGLGFSWIVTEKILEDSQEEEEEDTEA